MIALQALGDVALIFVCGLIPPVLVRLWADRDQFRAHRDRKRAENGHPDPTRKQRA